MIEKKMHWRTRFALVIGLWLLLFPSALIAGDRNIRAKAIREGASVQFSGQYQLSCQSALVVRALDYPLLMGMLWAQYGFAPPYRITALNESGALHVEDPTGIAGDIWPVSATGARRIYLAEGKLSHWAVPMMNTGTAVFEFEISASGAATRMKMDVFIQPESGIAGTVLWVIAPILKAHIENRISLNIQDVTKILEDIERTPDQVVLQLPDDLRPKFLQAFGRCSF